MLKAKKILFLILTLSLMLVIASCGGTKPCKECVDDNSDGICDVCKKEMPEEEVADVPLFEDGEPTFQVVISEDASTVIRQKAVNSIKSMLRYDYDVTVDVFTEGSGEDSELDIEVLIGDVASRGDKYFLDGHTLGKNGYVIKIVGQKILINAGSEEMLEFAIETFAEDILAREDITDLVMTKDDVVLEVQDDYRVTALKVNGTDMRGYTIAADLTRGRYENAAFTLQDFIYSETGYWFDVVDIEAATDKSIIMKHVDGLPASESFKVSAKGSQLMIECAFDNMCEKASAQFTTNKLTSAKGEVDFKDTVYTQDISVVYYDDFGAKGDGRTDDFFAIYNAHVFANESGQTVKASRNPQGKVYYIYDTRPEPDRNNSVVSIPIRTTTDWQGVKFIIDDLNIPTFVVEDDEKHAMHYALGKGTIFSVLPDEDQNLFKFYDKAVLDQIVATGLNPDTKHIDFKVDGWDGPLMLIPYNSHHGVFRRRGSYGSIPLQSIGEDMHEIIVIDENGNVSPETPIMFEYTNIDYITVCKLDPSAAITVGNATIETISARVKNVQFINGVKDVISTQYINRGIYVTRSYTTVENIEHIVSGGYTLKERANGLESSNYQGMFRAAYANHVTFKNCISPGRQSYGGENNGHSSYGFNANCVNKIVLENCTQSNFWITYDEHEGIMIPHTEYVPGAVPSMSTVQIYNDSGKLVNVPMCWGIGGTNYCKNMEYIGSQLSRFDAHAGLYNGKIIDSSINAMALTGYGDMIVENVKWYQYQPKLAFFSLRSDYGYMWYGSLSAKNVEAYIYDITKDIPVLNIVGHAYTNFYYGYSTAFPNVTVDNLDVYSMKNQTPVEAGYSIGLFNFRSTSKKMHLKDDSELAAVFTCVDKNNDGKIDEPLFDSNFDGRIDENDKIDFDRDGVVGQTSIDYEKYKNLPAAEQNKGVPHPTCKRNLNTIKPPEFIKIINNDGVDGKGGYVYTIVNTAGQGISDGGWYRAEGTEDTMGGFFGGTKFIYGEGADDYLLGSNHTFQDVTPTFQFNGTYAP